MLQITIHHGQKRRRARQHPFETRRGQPAPTDPLHTTYVCVDTGKAAHQIGGVVGRVIVHDDQFPTHPDQACFEEVDQSADVFSFIEGWDDDG